MAGVFLLSTLVARSANARICEYVPDSSYTLVRDHLIRTVKEKNLRGYAMQSQLNIAAKSLGMMMAESGGDPTKITIHGRESDRTPDYDYKNRNDKVSIGAVEKHLKEYLGRSRYSTNFGILQKSPDTVIYNGDSHKAGRERMSTFQKLAKAKSSEELTEYCLADRVYKENATQIGAQLKKLAACNFRLDVKFGKKSTKVIENSATRSCFAKIAMLCPAIQLDWIGDLSVKERGNYFGTKNASPLCSKTLKGDLENALKAKDGNARGNAHNDR